MPRTTTLPPLYDECKRLTITKLVSWNYIVPNQVKSGTVTWKTNGIETGSIGIRVEMYSGIGFLHLDYRAHGEPISYCLTLSQVPSNLGKGVIWYFVCPKTGKRCRNLYLIGGYFFHRSAFTGAFYQWQVFSRNTRNLCKSYALEFAHEKAYELLYSKNFKRTYNGKPTKRFLQVQQSIRAVEGIAL